MKRLIKENGLGQMYLNDLKEDIVCVYHGTAANNYYNILDNGLVDGGGVSYQKNNWGTMSGIWVTLKKIQQKHMQFKRQKVMLVKMKKMNSLDME